MEQNDKPMRKKSGEDLLTKQFKSILNRLDRADLERWLLGWSAKDPKFRDFFIAEFEQKTQKIDVDKYAKIIRRGISAASDRHGYIDYYHAENAVSEANDLLSMYEESFKTSDPAEIISVCFAVIEEAAPELECSDDSEGEIYSVVEEAIGLLKRTVMEHELSAEVKKETWSLCFKNYNITGLDNDGWDVDLLGIAGQLVERQEQRKQLFSVLDKMDKSASWHYTNERTAKIRHAVILQMEGEEAAEKYLESVIHLPEIRKKFVEKHILNKQYQKAKELCIKGIQSDQKYGGIVNDWQKYLLRIAELEQDTSEIIRLSTLLFLGSHNDPHHYSRLKEHTPANQWPGVVESLIQKLKTGRSEYNCTWIYIQEGMFDRLFEYVKSRPSIEKLEEFEKHLKDKYRDELLAMYEKEIRQWAKQASTRKSYAECCRVLGRMKKLGKPEQVKLLVGEFQNLYRKQPAFLDELRKV